MLMLGKKMRQSCTARGRATKIMKRPASTAKPVMGSRLCASTKSPRMMKSEICRSHVSPSKKVSILFLWTSFLFPTSTPMI